MHTLVTGGSGFIGQYLVTALLQQGRSVRIIDVRPPTRAQSGVEFLKGSVLDPAAMREAVRDIDEVYHLAALPGMWLPRKDDFHTINGLGTEAVLAAIRESKVKRLLHCSLSRFSSAALWRNASCRNRSTRRSTKCPGHTHAQN